MTQAATNSGRGNNMILLNSDKTSSTIADAVKIPLADTLNPIILWSLRMQMLNIQYRTGITISNQLRFG